MLNRLIFPFILLLGIASWSYGKTTLSGYVRDAASGELLIGAHVVTEIGGRGTSTNEYGYYALSLDPGEYTLLFSFMGYESVSVPINLHEDRVFNMELKESLQELEEITISSAHNNANITGLETGTTRLPIQSIRKIPALLGEVDVIKAIQLLPGVQVMSEGSSGFSVRGGGRDQNLVLLDEANIYNPSHVLGLFSIFNNDAIKDVKLYKGDIPARSGGRLASVLDIRMKEGNSKQFSARGGIGTIASRLTLEGPIVSDKISFLIAGRRTYADLFLILSGNETIRRTKLHFYDLNGKLNYRINEKNNIYLSGYYGKDVYENEEFGGFLFGNRTYTLRWNHLFGKKLFSNFTLLNSYYFYDLGTSEESTQYMNWKSNIEDYGFKGDFTWYPTPEHRFHFGLSAVYHTIRPGTITAISQGGINQEAELSHYQSMENGLYFSGESKLGKELSLRYGLRYSIFMNIGPSTIYEFDQGYQITDSTLYEKGEIFNVNYLPEPRLAINYTLGENHSLKASYARTIQYIQMASNSTAGTPLEVWFPASPNTKPQISDQVSAGYFRNFLNNRLHSSLEVYYKKMSNSIDFRDHAQLMLNPRLEGELRIGEATSAGAELMMRYDGSDFSGSVNYTFSRTIREFQEINRGVPYAAPYDKPHDLALTASYNASARITLAANWVYSTGLPYSMPSGRYVYMNSILPLYTGRNESRLPDYHRLDLSLTLRGKGDPGRRWRGELNFSIYNAYARKNVWTLNFVQDKEQPDVTHAEATYLFSIIPAVGYNFIF
ncbi:MAG: TonB-dependent receptor [Bacteroidetes bacterium]|nr:TonB-dependent receptor [Bacteroidota bacterium]